MEIELQTNKQSAKDDDDYDEEEERNLNRELHRTKDTKKSTKAYQISSKLCKFISWQTSHLVPTARLIQFSFSASTI